MSLEKKGNDMGNANTACYSALKRYVSSGIFFLLLLFLFMSCKGKSEEKTETTTPLTEVINIENSIRALETGDIDTSVKAASDLGNSGNPEAMYPLLTALEEYADPEVRKAAALALGVLGEPDCTDRLISALVEEDSTEVRNAICKSLQEYEGFSIDPILYLVRDSDVKTREQGVKHLVAIGDTVLEDVMAFVQESGRITFNMDADTLRKEYRKLLIATNISDASYQSNAVGYCLWLYMDDRNRIEKMKNSLKNSPYSVVDPYE